MVPKVPIDALGRRWAIATVAATAVFWTCGDGERSSVPVRAGEGEVAAPAAALDVVLFLGTSLTAGQGVAPEDAYPAVVQRKIDAAGLDFRVVNAGVSRESSAGGLRRLDWLLRQRVDVLVVELGANDGLRGQDIDAMRRNLQEIIDRTRAAYPATDIVIAGMEAPPNLGSRYTGRFRNVFRDLARKNDAVLIPFLLQGVAAEEDLNQLDGIHPNADGHKIMAETVWRVLEQVLGRRTGGQADGGAER